MTNIEERTHTVLEWCERVERDDIDALAVHDGTTSLTRGELGQRSRDLAGELTALGVTKGDRVAVCIDRSAALIVGLLGVIRAGAAYVAIDPTYPTERINWMLEDCAATAVIASADTADTVRSAAPQLITISPAGEIAPGATVVSDPATVVGAESVSESLTAEDAAYVVYTSGSTGRPKGVTIDHGGLLNLVRWHCSTFAVDAHTVCTQIASPGFDAAVWEIWPAVAVGAALEVVPEALRTDPLGLRDWLIAQRVNVGFVPTALAEALITLDWPRDTALRCMLAGGDALTRRPPVDLPFTLVNNYGVSEAAVVATSGAVAASGDSPPKIGRPIDGVLAEIRDPAGQPVGDGEAGELVLGGVAVGRGYLNLPELTADRFSEDERGRWYRTGDQMRFTPEGELEFLGRIDDQLSIRGFRVEPGEVVGALNAHPAISASAAVGVGDVSAERRLVAFLVSDDGIRPSDAELTAFLAPRLPEHMRPSSYVWLDTLPMTVHGKVDRAALTDAASDPNGQVAAGPGAASAGVTDVTVEAAIAATIADLLGVETIGAEENFFLLGGHSLLAAQLIVRIGELYDVEVSLRYLFDHPTARDIATEIERELAVDGGDTALATDTGATL